MACIVCSLTFKYLICPLQHDAACRVIARLKKERDEARALLAQAERQIPMSAGQETMNAATLSNGKRGSLFLSIQVHSVHGFLCGVVGSFFHCACSYRGW